MEQRFDEVFAINVNMAAIYITPSLETLGKCGKSLVKESNSAAIATGFYPQATSHVGRVSGLT